MGYSTKRGFYETLPSILKQGVRVVPFSWIAGGAYRKTYDAGVWFDHASASELNAYRERALKKILEFAVREIPAYQSFASIVQRYNAREALKEFPTVDKDTVQADLQSYLPRNFEHMPYYRATTGGTSGNQLTVFLDDKSQSIEMGFVHRFMNRMGYRTRHRKATFRGVQFSNIRPGIYWQTNPIYNELQFSPFHMSENNLAAYVDRLIRYRPAYLHGYPSAISILAEFIMRHDLASMLPSIRSVFLASEACTELQRERIETAFRTRAFSWYGHTERVIFGGECEKNSTYHHFPDYGIMEIVGSDGHLCEREGEQGELVGTGLNNFCMPLIRYRTGDRATRLRSECACGRAWDRFTSVEGRWDQDMLIGKSGSRISLAALNMHGPLFDHVVRYQYYQNTKGICVLRLLVTKEFSEQEQAAIQTAFEAKVNGEVDFKTEIVPDIPLTARGKFRRLESTLASGSPLPTTETT